MLRSEPSYKEYIAPNASRRMAKGVKMGIATATEALKEAHITTPDAIWWVRVWGAYKI